MSLLKRIHEHPDFVTRSELDQCHATPSTVLRRLTFLGRRCSDILLLGDDDLLSLALALTGARKRTVVVDIDEKLLGLISVSSAGHQIELVSHDLRTELPYGLRGRFDEVFTDPPYTLAGQMLFVHRALAALRTTGDASLYVCASRSYLTGAQLGEVRCFLSAAGFELEGSYPGFNRYKAPPDVRRDLKDRGWRCVTWLYSDLFHFVRRQALPIPGLPTQGERDIYKYGEYETSPTT